MKKYGINYDGIIEKALESVLFTVYVINNPKILFLYKGNLVIRIDITSANRVSLHLMKKDETISRYSLDTFDFWR